MIIALRQRLAFVLLLSAILPLRAQQRKKAFHIDSAPSGALVFVNGAEMGTTPYSYEYDKTPTANTTIELRKEGWGARTIDMVMILRDQHAAKTPLLVKLYREFDTEQRHTDVPVVTMTKDPAFSTADLGSIGTKKIKKDAREVYDLDYPDQLTADLIGGMRNTFATAHTVRRATQKGDEAIRKAKFFLSPVLKDLHIDVVEFDGRVYGKVDVDIDWRFMNGLSTDSVLFNIHKRTSWPVFMESKYELLHGALRDAARQLVEEDGLQERLNKAFDDGLMLSKGSVVNIARPPGITFNGRKEMLAQLVKGVVTVKTKDGHGSGFLIAQDGYIVTNAHVVGEESTVTVKFNQGFTLEGRVVKVNRDFDLALVKTPGEDMAAMALGDDAQLLIGEELFAIGTPLDEQLGQTVTRGIMSGRREFQGRTFLQTDVSINPGNSGGPIVDENGKVVGVATLKIAEEGVQGIGFAVPASKIVEMLNLHFLDR